MGWFAYVDTDGFGVRSKLSIVYDPIRKGERPEQLIGNIDIPVELPFGQVVKCKVHELTQDNAIFEDNNGRLWNITPAVESDYYGITSPHTFGGFPVPEWVIRKLA